MVVARGVKTGTLYINSSCKSTVAVVDSATNSELWHNRLGHMSEKGMKILHSKEKLPKLKAIDYSLCKSSSSINRKG